MKFTILLLSILLLHQNIYSQNPEDIEANYLLMRKSVVAIGTVVIDSLIVNGKKVGVPNFKTVGTGLKTYIRLDSGTVDAIVTAGHVIKYFTDHKQSYLYLRPSLADTIPTTEYFGIPLPVVNKDGIENTYLYPEKNIDIGCIVWPAMYGDKLTEASGPVFPYNNMTVPYLGDQVWVGGYPDHIETPIQSQFFYTISTFKPAHVAWKPSANMANQDLSHITLIESNATHGNSGGPVFSLHKTLELVGILTSGYSEMDPVYLNGKPAIDATTHQPYMANVRAGVSIIEKAEYVRKLMNYVTVEFAKKVHAPKKNL